MYHEGGKVGAWKLLFKKGVKSILKKPNQKVPEDQIDHPVARFFQKIFSTKEPAQIYDLIRLQRTRKNAEIRLKHIPRQKPFTKLMLNSMAMILNRIPEELKEERPNLFKQKLKKKRLNPRQK